jgi:hypothetical protein
MTIRQVLIGGVVVGGAIAFALHRLPKAAASTLVKQKPTSHVKVARRPVKPEGTTTLCQLPSSSSQCPLPNKKDSFWSTTR